MPRGGQAGGQLRNGLLAGRNLLLITLDTASEFNLRPNQAIGVNAAATPSAQQVDVGTHRRGAGWISCGPEALGSPPRGVEPHRQTPHRRDGGSWTSLTSSKTWTPGSIRAS